MDRRSLEYGRNWSRDAEDRLWEKCKTATAKDAGLKGGQGRTPEDVGRDGSAGAILLAIVVIVVLLALCGGYRGGLLKADLIMGSVQESSDGE